MTASKDLSPFIRSAVSLCLLHTPAAPSPDAPYVWHLRDIDALPTYARGNVALLGDAAHGSLPWTGLGISAAALDAQRLATRLAEVCSSSSSSNEAGAVSTGVATALTKYDLDRKPRGHAVQKAARASDGGQGPSAYRTGRFTFRVLPLVLLYGVQVSIDLSASDS
jgi:2-polyprenyl-6-methoxyphenol hydroxylase-like FAD-dependent oxidoreductase